MRYSIKLFCCAFCAIILISFSIVKQNDPVELILENLNAYATTYSPNKIYLQTDRSIYALEDTVWFKAYTINATYNFPTDKSKVIYVDIVDSNGNKVVGKKLYAEYLGAASDFFIEREWTPGRYKLRAYTKYMLNQDQKFIYNKEIQIVDINKASDEILISPNTESSKDVIDPSVSLEIKFFPESGDLVAGIDSRVAIKIENYSADLGNLSGTIEDKSGNAVVKFEIIERGVGLASFKPKVGKKYFAKLDNNPKLYPLPEVKAKGYNITTLSKSDKVSFIITTNVEPGLSAGDVLIHSRGRLVYHEKLDDTVEYSYGLQLDNKDLPTGVTQITYFDKKGIPRSERLFFVDNNIAESVIKTDKTTYSKREKVDLNLSIINANLKSFDCAVSVFDKSNLKGARPSDNIKSWMLLNSDLRGEINDPNFYFEQTGDRKRAHLLDLLMMTHGWRRFDWEDLNKKEVFQDLEYKKEQGHFVSGHTSRLLNNKAPIKSKVMLNFLNNDFSQEVVTGEDGRFTFGPFNIEDRVTAIIQARRYKEGSEEDFLDGNRKLEINLDAPEYLILEKPKYEEIDDFDFAAYKRFINTNRNAQALKDQAYNMEVTLSEVLLTAKRKTKEDTMDRIATEKSKYSTPSNRIIVEENDRTKYLSVFDFLQEVPGVTVTGVFPSQTVLIRGYTSIEQDSRPVFLLDGFPIALESVYLISPNEIFFIDVLKGSAAAFLGVRGANGAIAIYTGRYSERKVTRRAPGIVDVDINGFDRNRQFYSPDYSKNSASMYEPDVRATLYWNPNIFLSKGEEKAVSFYTADNTGDYVVITEGLSEDGEPIFGTNEFSVVENK